MYKRIKRVSIYPGHADRTDIKIERERIVLDMFNHHIAKDVQEETLYVTKPFYLEVTPANIKIHDKQLVPSFEIEKVIFNGPATIVKWKDGTKTVVKCQVGDVFDYEKGLAMCFTKKALGNKGDFNNVLREHMPPNQFTIAQILERVGKTVVNSFYGFNGGKNNEL